MSHLVFCSLFGVRLLVVVGFVLFVGLVILVRSALVFDNLVFCCFGCVVLGVPLCLCVGWCWGFGCVCCLLFSLWVC